MVKPEDTEVNRVYYYCEMNIPGVVLDITVHETEEERNIYADALVTKWNLVYNGKSITDKPDGVNGGNCVSGFLGKWRFMRVEAQNEQAGTVQTGSQNSESDSVYDGSSVISIK